MNNQIQINRRINNMNLGNCLLEEFIRIKFSIHLYYIDLLVEERLLQYWTWISISKETCAYQT